MSYVNAGAYNAEMGGPFPTKAALKRAVFSDPSSVLLYRTALGESGRMVSAAQLAQDGDTDSWSIVGPDPFTNRKWYATLTVNRLGNLKVS